LVKGAFILEQEGWLIGRAANSELGAGNGRLRRFCERYTEWQEKVKQFRTQFPGEWPEPPDNS